MSYCFSLFTHEALIPTAGHFLLLVANMNQLASDSNQLPLKQFLLIKGILFDFMVPEDSKPFNHLLLSLSSPPLFPFLLWNNAE